MIYNGNKSYQQHIFQVIIRQSAPSTVWSSTTPSSATPPSLSRRPLCHASPCATPPVVSGRRRSKFMRLGELGWGTASVLPEPGEVSPRLRNQCSVTLLYQGWAPVSTSAPTRQWSDGIKLRFVTTKIWCQYVSIRNLTLFIALEKWFTGIP